MNKKKYVKPRTTKVVMPMQRMLLTSPGGYNMKRIDILDDEIGEEYVW